MKRAVGTGSPRTLTFASMSAFGSRRAVPPTAMMMTQVPVEITVNGARRDRRCGTREAFESCAPQMMRTFEDKPVAAATSGLTVPSVSQALRIGGKSRRQPSLSTMLERSPSFGRHRSVCAPMVVNSVAATPLRRHDQYCG